MALNYATCAKEIYEALGGRENLVSAAHGGLHGLPLCIANAVQTYMGRTGRSV